MKTLGDTGLMPEKKHTFNCVDECDCKDLEFNQAIDQLSALPILAVVKKAVDMGLVRIKKCETCRADGIIYIMTGGSGTLGFTFHRTETCPTCSGNGFRITEGE